MLIMAIIITRCIIICMVLNNWVVDYFDVSSSSPIFNKLICEERLMSKNKIFNKSKDSQKIQQKGNKAVTDILTRYLSLLP